MASSKMYFLTVSMVPQKEGIDPARFIQKLSGILSDSSSIPKVVYKFKVSGEPRVLLVLHVSNLLSLENFISGICGLGAVEVDCQPIVTYESFARTLKVDEDLAQPNTNGLSKEGLYWLDFDVDYHGKTTDKLLKIWKKEAEAVYDARLKGTSIELYKCVAQRKVHAFMNMAVPEQLDALALKLPLMHKNGANVQLKCRALQYLDDYASSVSTETL